MIRQHKWRLLLTSLITLLPIVAGLILWDTLPERIATHWGVNGEPDGYSSRAFAVFGLPLFLLSIHWLGVLATTLDKKNKDNNRKMQRIVLWICPVISLIVSAAIYAWVAKIPFRMEKVAPLLVGLGFIVIGNYLPKCKQNYTIGIKIVWTLESEENWNATHRFGGRVWMLGGVLFLVTAFLPQTLTPYALFILLPIMVAVPVLYSYFYYRKHQSK